MHDVIRTILIREGVIELVGLEIDCAVVKDNNGNILRLLSQRKLGEALGKEGNTTALIQNVIVQQSLKNHITSSLEKYLQAYTWKSSRGIAPRGYRAELLPELCDLYLAARNAGALQPEQMHIAERCERMMRAFARVGVAAYIDEGTGFQEIRPDDALQRMIEIYLQPIPDELRPMFTPEFWKPAFSLYGLAYHPIKRPTLLAGFVSRSVYDHMPPPLYGWLKEKNPITRDEIKRQYMHHQFFKEGVGKELVQRQISRVIDAAHGVNCRKERREEFWHLLHNMCDQSRIVPRVWETAQLDLGFQGLPLFRSTP